ncbi:MAG: hypothetical protein PGMFKBFP_00423 [Anaerolineales bacterium]|nr:hypothetical protein [Anaerolineales bacterium]
MRALQEAVHDDVGAGEVGGGAAEQTSISDRDQQFAGFDARAARHFHRDRQHQRARCQVVHEQREEGGDAGEETDQPPRIRPASFEQQARGPAGHAAFFEDARQDEQGNEDDDDGLAEPREDVNGRFPVSRLAEHSDPRELQAAQRDNHDQRGQVNAQAVGNHQGQRRADDEDQQPLWKRHVYQSSPEP